MARTYWRKLFGRFLAGLLAAAALAWPSHAQDHAAPIPNFAGLWARMTFGAEPPPSGPGPLVNLMHLPNGAADGGKLVGDYMNPILRPAAAEQVRRQGEISKTGVPFPDPSNQCAPQSPPFILRQQQIQLLQREGQVAILYMLDHHVRHVRLNAKHPARVTPSWSGDSVGHSSNVNRQTKEIRWPADEVLRAGDKTITFRVNVVLQPGRSQISIGVMDEKSHEKGFERLSV